MKWRGLMSFFEDWASKIIEQLPPVEPELSKAEAQRDNNIPNVGKIFREITGDLSELSADIINQATMGRADIPLSNANDELFRSRVLENESAIAIEKSLETYGFESLAFYKSIHFRNNIPFPSKWGIFIFEYSLPWLSEEIESYYPGIYRNQERLLKSFKLIHRHERFHFHLDAWTIGHEGIQKKPLYSDYMKYMYQRWHPSDFCVEESLANRHALDALKREGMREFLIDFMSRQPGAYANFAENQDELRAELASQVLFLEDKIATKLLQKEPSYDQIPFIAHGRNSVINDSACPVYLIKGFTPVKLFPSEFRPEFDEHENFVRRYLSGKPLSPTDHAYYIIDNGERLKIPNPHKKERLTSGEFRNNRKKAGLSTSEYRSERNRTNNWKKNVPRAEPKPPIK